MLLVAVLALVLAVLNTIFLGVLAFYGHRLWWAFDGAIDDINEGFSSLDDRTETLEMERGKHYTDFGYKKAGKC